MAPAHRLLAARALNLNRALLGASFVDLAPVLPRPQSACTTCSHHRHHNTFFILQGPSEQSPTSFCSSSYLSVTPQALVKSRQHARNRESSQRDASLPSSLPPYPTMSPRSSCTRIATNIVCLYRYTFRLASAATKLVLLSGRLSLTSRIPHRLIPRRQVISGEHGLDGSGV